MKSKSAIGFVGLGAMGRGSAKTLINKDFDVVGYDIRSEGVEWIRDNGGRAANTLAELAEQAFVIVSYVVNSEQTESVLFGNEGLSRHMKPGTVFISCSTLDPAYVDNLSERLSGISIKLIDAPVTGGADGASNGNLTIMGSGETEAFEQVRPVLEGMGKKVHYLGPAGSGTRMKMVNQLLVGANLAAAAEAIGFAKNIGVPAQTALDILSSGAADSWMLRSRGTRMLTEHFDKVEGAVDLFVKDLSIVLEAANKARFKSSIAHSAYLSYLEASQRGYGNKDCAAIVSNYQ
jgi:putative dehydrogenase